MTYALKTPKKAQSTIAVGMPRRAFLMPPFLLGR